MIKAGIIGATGYAGNEIVRLLLEHKEAEIVWYGSRSYIDKKYTVYQNFFKLVDAKWRCKYGGTCRGGRCDFYCDASGTLRISYSGRNSF